MPVELNVSADVRQVERWLSDAARKQIPFATAKALSAAADAARISIMRRLPQTFDNPTSFTMRGVAIKTARKSDLEARVFIKTAQAEYLALEETGGTRQPKKTALVLPGGIKTNAHGNLTRAAFARAKARKNTFVGTVHGIGGLWQRPPRGLRRDGTKGTKGATKAGVVQGMRTGLTLLAVFKRAAQYAPRFGFQVQAQSVAARAFPVALRQELAMALKTAR